MLWAKLSLKARLKRRKMDLEKRLKDFGLPVDKVVPVQGRVDKDAPYTVVNISESTVILPQVLPSGVKETITLNPFGYVDCATTIPGSVLSSLSVRQFWLKGYLAVLAGDVDTSFLLNCVPLGTKNPYSVPFFDKIELNYSTPMDAASDPGISLDPAKIEAIAKPLADKLQTASAQQNIKGGNVEISGEFHPENFRGA